MILPEMLVVLLQRHVFAHQRTRFGPFIRMSGLARAEAKLTLANLAFDRLERRAAKG